jgi:hypothetical protein
MLHGVKSFHSLLGDVRPNRDSGESPENRLQNRDFESNFEPPRKAVQHPIQVASDFHSVNRLRAKIDNRIENHAAIHSNRIRSDIPYRMTGREKSHNPPYSQLMIVVTHRYIESTHGNVTWKPFI